MEAMVKLMYLLVSAIKKFTQFSQEGEHSTVCMPCIAKITSAFPHVIYVCIQSIVSNDRPITLIGELIKSLNTHECGDFVCRLNENNAINVTLEGSIQEGQTVCIQANGIQIRLSEHQNEYTAEFYCTTEQQDAVLAAIDPASRYNGRLATVVTAVSA